MAAGGEVLKSWRQQKRDVNKKDLHLHLKELGSVPEEPEGFAPLASVALVVGLQVWVDASCCALAVRKTHDEFPNGILVDDGDVACSSYLGCKPAPSDASIGEKKVLLYLCSEIR